MHSNILFMWTQSLPYLDWFTLMNWAHVDPRKTKASRSLNFRIFFEVYVDSKLQTKTRRWKKSDYTRLEEYLEWFYNEVELNLRIWERIKVSL